MEILKNRLKELRNEAGITQQTVADAIYVKLGTYGSYEKGINPSLETLVLLARYYDVSTDYLLGVIDKRLPLRLPQRSESETALTRLARVPQPPEVEHPLTPYEVTELINALITYIAAGQPSGSAPLETAGIVVRALTSFLECAAGNDFAALLDAANTLASAGLTAQDTVKARLQNPQNAMQ